MSGKVLAEAKVLANPVKPPLCLRQPVTLGKPWRPVQHLLGEGGVGVPSHLKHGVSKKLYHSRVSV